MMYGRVPGLLQDNRNLLSKDTDRRMSLGDALVWQEKSLFQAGHAMTATKKLVLNASMQGQYDNETHPEE